MKSMSSFAENLKRLMKDRGITARTLSQATGIPTSTISEWSAGREPKLSKSTVKLARYFDVSIEFLITGEEPEQTVVSNLIENFASEFTTIHQGLYRVKVEKLKENKNKKEE